MARHHGIYKIQMDGRWTLDDLYEFPHTFEQAYFALDALTPSDSQLDFERINRALRGFPWQGGYSAVNFYNQLKYATPISARPTISSIQYASPGWIDLSLILEQAQLLAEIVAAVAGSIAGCNALYNKIMTDLQRRKLLRIEVEREKIVLQHDELRLINEYSRQIAEMLELGSPDSLDERTGRPLVSLKILLSFYRRVRSLAEYRNEDKALLPTDIPHSPREPPQ